ncbi:5-oxoprolinase subunit PxpB [Alkalibacillus salilacus]|uniref:Inhibitor of KinA n=1 Tax=Alkalibacillus salilacus TaxID=284582 RepID=A0ABT9VEX9_9BACI|nr:5-oxoprolinase subunit PxpB [Alkalibacillus salilacus]MDQ0159360.1 inhibitor of KinA [Alkalibacillus salilacus]
MRFTLYPLGNEAVVVVLGETISPAIHDDVVHYYQMIQQADLHYVTDIVPTYRSIAVYYNWRQTNYGEMTDLIEKILNQDDSSSRSPQRRTIHLPVCYDEAVYAPDLAHLAQVHQLTEKEVIERHTAPCYRVYMIGFLPGFPYMGGLDSTLETPRLTTPRAHVPAGSVGIAGAQTGVYPVDSPGGWQIIGHTPIQLYNPDSDDPTLLKMGDWLTFQSISKETYELIKQEGRIEDFIEEG